MSEVRVSVIFCEDIRFEFGDKPMILGILNPSVFSAIPNGSPDDLSVAAIATAPWEIDTLAAELSIEISHPDGKVTRDEYHRVLTRPPEVREGEDWSAFLPLEIADFRYEYGGRVKATFAAGGAATYATVLMHHADELDSPLN